MSSRIFMHKAGQILVVSVNGIVSFPLMALKDMSINDLQRIVDSNNFKNEAEIEQFMVTTGLAVPIVHTEVSVSDGVVSMVQQFTGQ